MAAIPLQAAPIVLESAVDVNPIFHEMVKTKSVDLAPFVSEFDDVMKEHKEIDFSSFNDDDAYRNRLNEARVCL